MKCNCQQLWFTDCRQLWFTYCRKNVDTADNVCVTLVGVLKLKLNEKARIYIVSCCWGRMHTALFNNTWLVCIHRVTIDIVAAQSHSLSGMRIFSQLSEIRLLWESESLQNPTANPTRLVTKGILGDFGICHASASSCWSVFSVYKFKQMNIVINHTHKEKDTSHKQTYIGEGFTHKIKEL